MVIDTSLILSIWFEEASGAWAADLLDHHAANLWMSTVNLTECLILARNRRPSSWQQLETALLSSGISFVPPDVQQARHAAEARVRFPLNLGDCFAYALARHLNDAVATCHRDFRHLDIPVHHP